MKTLITGGAGFIGSHLAEECIKQGFYVDILDNLSNGFERNVPPEANLYTFSVGDDEACRLLENGYDVVFHHAAQLNLRKSVEDPVGDFRDDVLGSIMLFDAAVKTGVKHIIFASSGGAIYGEHDVLPVAETASKDPLSPYGLNKLFIEDYLRYYHRMYGIRYTSLRYANVYGPRQNHESEAGVISIFIEKMLKNEQVVINGDGKQTRDYVYISDVVDANIRCVQQGFCGEINIATSIETDVNELFTELKTRTGYGWDEYHGPAKEGEQRRSVLDISLAENEIGWKPVVPLSEGYDLTVDFFRKLQ